MASSTPIPTTPDDAEDERPQVLVVEVEGTLCALPVEWVREVIRPRAITVIPGAPPVARGLVNVRGLVVTVLDLAEALRAERETAGVRSGDGTVRAVVPPSVVLLEHGGRVIGVAVDAVHDVRPLDGGLTSTGTNALPNAAMVGGANAEMGSRIACELASAGDDIVTRLDLGVLLARVMLSSEEGP